MEDGARKIGEDKETLDEFERLRILGSWNPGSKVCGREVCEVPGCLEPLPLLASLAFTNAHAHTH